MSKATPIEFEWDNSIHGNEILVARKACGKISITELQEALSADYRFLGGWAIIIKASDESGYQGWGDVDERKGEAVELYRLEDYATCPICAAVYEGIENCPHCGKKLRNREG